MCNNCSVKAFLSEKNLWCFISSTAIGIYLDDLLCVVSTVTKKGALCDTYHIVNPVCDIYPENAAPIENVKPFTIREYICYNV